jgi:hypothetical protein
MFAPVEATHWMHPASIGLLVAITAHHLLHRLGGPRVVRLLELRKQRWYSPAVLMSMWWLIVVYYPAGPAPFIYFQF